MATKIVMVMQDRVGRPYMGVFDFEDDRFPSLHINGALKEVERAWLIQLARRAKKAWLPAYPEDPECTPLWIQEATWIQPGNSYHKFEFNPPLEVENVAQIPGDRLAKIKEANRWRED